MVADQSFGAARAVPRLGDDVPIHPVHIDERMHARIAWMERAGINPLDLAGMVITVAAYKGGVGKTTIAKELAYLLGAIYLDFEWDEGSGSVSLGYRQEDRATEPLMDALRHGRPPRVVPGGPFKPDFVPGNKKFEAAQPTADHTRELLESWAKEWGRERGCPVVVDTHPGGSPSTLGAIFAANVVVTPAVLAEFEMKALQGMVDELPDYPLLLVPNQVGVSPPARYLDWLERLTTESTAEVGPVIHEYRWLRTRALKIVVCAAGRVVAKRTQPFVDDVHAVAEGVADYVRRAA